MSRKSEDKNKSSFTFSYDGSATTSSSGSTTASAQFPPDPEPSDHARTNFDELATMAANLAAAKAEQIINERLVAANQAQMKTAKMLAEATSMVTSIKVGLETSAKMQVQLESDVANIKGNAVSALSIFVSFFAFITVSINVFSKAGSVVSASALVLVFWCLLIGFNIMIGWQFNTLRNSGLAWFVLILVSCVSVFSVVGMYYFSPELLSTSKAVLTSRQ